MTKRDTLQLLCKSVVTRLENQKAITFPPRLRQIVQDEIHGLIAPFVLTDEDLKEKILEKVGAKAEMLQDSAFTDSEQFRAAKAVVRNMYANEELNGFYFQKTPRFVVHTIVEYFMRSSHIDDVFETDEDLEKQILGVMKDFDPERLH